MSKSKKKPDTPPVKTRKYTLPKEYLLMVADRIVSTNPTKEIVYNTLCGVWNSGRENGYFEKHEETKNFRNRREAVIKEMFDHMKDKVDDVIHGGVIETNNNQ